MLPPRHGGYRASGPAPDDPEPPKGRGGSSRPVTFMSARQYRVACPTCGAAPEQVCRTLTTCRVTDTHIARIEAAYPAPSPQEPTAAEAAREQPDPASSRDRNPYTGSGPEGEIDE